MSELKLTGKLIELLPEETITGKNGDMKKQSFIIETPGQYPKKVCIVGWEKLVPVIQQTQIGTTVTAYLDLSSREHNGRWYSEIKCWKIDKDASAQTAAPVSRPEPEEDPEENDSLPF